MKIYKLWESTGGMVDSIDMKAQIIRIDDEYNMEIVCRNSKSLWERIKIAVSYVLYKSPIFFGTVPLSREDIKGLKELSEDVRE